MELADTKASLAREQAGHRETRRVNAESIAELEEVIAEHGREEGRLRTQITRLEAASKSAIKAALRGRQYFAAQHLLQPLRVVQEGLRESLSLARMPDELRRIFEHNATLADDSVQLLSRV